MMRKLLVACIMVLALASFVMAAITEQEAAKLGGPILTPVGAEKSGNKEGTIPPWTGGITKGPDGYYYEGKLKVPFSKVDAKKTGTRPNPFADDRPLFSITSQNVAKYANKLSEGVKGVMKKYPDWRLDVYPTRRPAHYTQEVIDGTLKSALSARLTNNGTTLTGARLGFPFPIPKDALEALHNHLIFFDAPMSAFTYRSFLINAAGRKSLTSLADELYQHPYWDPAEPNPKFAIIVRDLVREPPNRNGEGLMVHQKLDQSTPGAAYLYLPGQRRVKLAPEVSFDGPNTSVAGASVYDETFIYTGSPEKYNWKLLGKKEMYVPYNQYKLIYVPVAEIDKLIGPHYFNPDYMRWELHRVWVVEGTLKPGQRHLYSKRVMYLDEDTWRGLIADTYDMNGKIYRVIMDNMTWHYDYPAPCSNSYAGYDLNSGIYYVNGLFPPEDGGWRYVTPLKMSEWNPSVLAGKGVR